MTPDNIDVLNTILEIQTGNQDTRENFISEYKPFVAKTAMNLCKRPLAWGADDELSIGLIAFNSAIDSYDSKKQVPFLPYAKVVIQNRIKDYFRKQSRLNEECSLDTEADSKMLSPAELQSSWADYRDRTIEEDRRDELIEYEKLLDQFGIDFEVLAEVSPKHRDSRQNLFSVAKTVAETQEYIKVLLEKKQLPISDLVFKTGTNRKTLERGRKFIIATALVIYYPMEFPYIYSYINKGNA